jgi:hypothetical protein
MTAEPFDLYRAAGLTPQDLADPFGMSAPGRAGELAAKFEPLESIRPSIQGQYLVKGWFDRGALSVVFGESNVGKTFLALDLAMHVAAGLDWHGARIPSGADWPGSALYVAGEGGRGVHNRIEALRRARPELVAAAERQGGFDLLPTALDLCGTGDAEALTDALAQMAAFPTLIIIDTLARAMGGGDENSGQDMGALVRNVDLIRDQTGAHVMLIHHSGKDASRGARGHSSLRAAADTEIELTRSGDVVMAEAKKQRDVSELGRFAYKLLPVTIGQDGDGDEVTSAVVEPTEAVKRGPTLRGQQLTALQALDDALAHHGAVKLGDLWPTNRQCVSLDVWREFCDRHSLSSGSGNSSQRTAFHKARTALQNKGLIRVVDGFVWRVAK